MRTISNRQIEDMKEGTMVHYHIRCSESKLDWEAFRTQQEAETEARQFVRPGESYTIENFDGNCPRCADGLKTSNTLV